MTWPSSLRAVVVASLAMPIGACVEERIVHAEADETSACSCPDPEAQCVAGLCAKLGPCDDTSCGPVFTCNGPGGHGQTQACVCDPDPSAWVDCAPECTEDQECSAGFQCQQPEGICRYQDRCLSDELCDDGKVCAYSHVANADAVSPFGGNTCQRPGESDIGETCTVDTDCTSGHCRFETCSPGSCRFNADCAPDQRCLSRRCAPVAGPCEYCDAPNRLCLEGSAGCVQGCSLSGDCDIGDCRGVHQSMHCVDDGRRCADDEFLLTSDASFGGDGPACAIHQACWAADDCAQPYACIRIADGATGYCGRRLTAMSSD